MRRGIFGAIFAMSVMASVFVGSQSADAAAGATYGNVNSTVVPQPDGAPSIFIPAEGVIYNSWSANGGWPWHPLALYTMAPPATSAMRGFATSRATAVLQPDGSPSIFFQGVGGSLWNYWYVNGTWDAAEIVSSGVQSAPVAVLQPNGSPTVFVMGPNNSLLNYWYIPLNATWGSGTVAGPGSVFQVPTAVASPYDGTPEVFDEGPNHSLLGYSYCSSPCGASPAIGWFSYPVAGRDSAYSAPAAMVQPDDTVSLFVLGLNNTLLNFWENQTPAPPCPPGSPCPPSSNTLCSASPTTSGSCWNSATVAEPELAYSSPAVALQPNGLPTVFFVGPDGSLLNEWYVPSQGNWGAATLEAPGSSSSQVFGVLAQTDGTPEVFFAQQDGSLWLSSYAQGKWNSFNWGVNDAPVETFTDAA